MNAREPDAIDHWMKHMGDIAKERTGRTKWNADWVPERDRKRDKKKKRNARS